MVKWIINNYPLRSIKSNVDLFNKIFNCCVTSNGLRKKAASLNVCAKKEILNEEQIDYVASLYKIHTVSQCVKIIKEKYGLTYTNEGLSRLIRSRGIKNYYTDEELNWIKNNCSNFSYVQLTDMFNILFDRNKTRDQIRNTCKKYHWYCISDVDYYTAEEDEWIKENYPKYILSREEVAKQFNQKFNSNRSAKGIASYAIHKGYIKNQSDYQYKKGNVTWNTGLTKEEFRKHFSDKAFNKMTFSVDKNFPNISRRRQYEKENKIKLSKDIRLTNIGNGEYIPVKKKYINRLTYHKLHKAGELTEFFYKVYEAEDLIKDKENER